METDTSSEIYPRKVYESPRGNVKHRKKLRKTKYVRTRYRRIVYRKCIYFSLHKRITVFFSCFILVPSIVVDGQSFRRWFGPREIQRRWSSGGNDNHLRKFGAVDHRVKTNHLIGNPAAEKFSAFALPSENGSPSRRKSSPGGLVPLIIERKRITIPLQEFMTPSIVLWKRTTLRKPANGFYCRVVNGELVSFSSLSK